MHRDPRQANSFRSHPPDYPLPPGPCISSGCSGEILHLVVTRLICSSFEELYCFRDALLAREGGPIFVRGFGVRIGLRAYLVHAEEPTVHVPAYNEQRLRTAAKFHTDGAPCLVMRIRRQLEFAPHRTHSQCARQCPPRGWWLALTWIAHTAGRALFDDQSACNRFQESFSDRKLFHIHTYTRLPCPA